MMLVIDLCYEKDSLSAYEFVKPIKRALSKAGAKTRTLHRSELQMADLCECKGAVLCGTALMDNEYAKSQELFSWIAGWDKPLLGICAGMQVIGTAYGARIIKQKEIGYRSIEITAKSRLLGDPRTIEGYHLHNFSSTIPEGFLLLAGNRNCVEAFKHENKETYGILFHPEVRNRWILEEFCRA